ncbi:MAG: DUF6179 domain-containing protein [Eubacteriales bacterium]|nr:DUF6179 domain-containing protein [Eubacteriales bacterium]
MTNGETSNGLLQWMPEEPIHEEQPEALYALLEERIRRYTMGDSTSVSMDTARRLLESILYCLELNRRYPAPDVTRESPLKERWEAGVHQAKRVCARAKFLLKQAQRTPPPLVNMAYCDTLEVLPAFFQGYDVDFFAQEIPCSFDYPLCQPVSESLLGAQYILDYLRRLLTESALLRAFSQESLRALYERYYIDYIDLLVNLSLPVAEMATLCALADRPVRELVLSQTELANISAGLTRAGEQEARAAIERAADHALEELHLSGASFVKLMHGTAADLLTRMRAPFDATRLETPVAVIKQEH